MGSRCYPLLPQSLTFRRKMEKPRERKNLYLMVNKFSEKEGPTSFLDKGGRYLFRRGVPLRQRLIKGMVLGDL